LWVIERFADWVPSADAFSLINELSTPDFIFTAHDYGPGDKGEVCFHLMSEKYRRDNECTWILPEVVPFEVILAPYRADDGGAHPKPPSRQPIAGDC
jgi:hypothetical protein